MTPPKSSALNASTLWQLTAGSLRVLKLIGRLGCAEGETAFSGPLWTRLCPSPPQNPFWATAFTPYGPGLSHSSHGFAGRYPHCLFNSSKVPGINNKACSCSSSSKNLRQDVCGELADTHFGNVRPPLPADSQLID